ncbi:MAG: hypothetical protein ABJA89_04420 [Lapillicoccus sp.]
MGTTLGSLAVVVVLGPARPAPTRRQVRGPDDAGFSLGVWQGFIAPIAFLVSLFNHSVGIYEVHNNGGWYNSGFIAGRLIFCGGGDGGTRVRSRSAKRSR